MIICLLVLGSAVGLLGAGVTLIAGYSIWTAVLIYFAAALLTVLGIVTFRALNWHRRSPTPDNINRRSSPASPASPTSYEYNT